VDAVGATHQGDVGAVVNDEHSADLVRCHSQPRAFVEVSTIKRALVPVLEQLDAGAQQGFAFSQGSHDAVERWKIHDYTQ